MQTKFTVPMVMLAVAAGSFVSLAPARADQYVSGYTRQNGTYVSPYVRSTPDGNPYNNYGSR